MDPRAARRAVWRFMIEATDGAHRRAGAQRPSVLQPLAGEEPARLSALFKPATVRVDGVDILVSRTGYTGEDGFELYLDPAAAPAIWDRLLELGQAAACCPRASAPGIPCGSRRAFPSTATS